MIDDVSIISAKIQKNLQNIEKSVDNLQSIDYYESNLHYVDYKRRKGGSKKK